MMLANQDIETLKISVSDRCGFELSDSQSCKLLSIDIFLKTDNYLSTKTLMKFFGLIDTYDEENPIVKTFLAIYVT